MAASYIFYNFSKNLLLGKFGNLTTATIKVCLLTDSATIDQDTWETYADIVNDGSEVAAQGGYTTGGKALTNITVTKSSGNTVLDADDVTWANSTITAHYAVLYLDSGTANTSYLIGYVDFGSNKSSDNGDFTLVWSSNGILGISV